jgi:protein-disulfide isomerase
MARVVQVTRAGWLMVALTASGVALAHPAAAEDKTTNLPVAEIEKIVHDYLLRNPEVVYDAIQELQKRQAADEANRQRSMIVSQAKDIFENPADPVAGDRDSKVAMVEFFDYHCGYCRAMQPSLETMMSQEGKVRFVFKEFPILGPDSVTAAKAALASQRQGRYLEMHQALMRAKDLSMSGVMEVARDVGLDTKRLAKDMESPEVKAVIDRNLALAQTLGINGTPSFVVGDQLVPGAVPVAQLAQLIDKERAAE